MSFFVSESRCVSIGVIAEVPLVFWILLSTALYVSVLISLSLSLRVHVAIIFSSFLLSDVLPHDSS